MGHWIVNTQLGCKAKTQFLIFPVVFACVLHFEFISKFEFWSNNNWKQQNYIYYIKQNEFNLFIISICKAPFFCTWIRWNQHKKRGDIQLSWCTRPSESLNAKRWEWEIARRKRGHSKRRIGQFEHVSCRCFPWGDLIPVQHFSFKLNQMRIGTNHVEHLKCLLRYRVFLFWNEKLLPIRELDFLVFGFFVFQFISYAKADNLIEHLGEWITAAFCIRCHLSQALMVDIASEPIELWNTRFFVGLFLTCCRPFC